MLRICSLLLLLAGCATSPHGRKQLSILSDRRVLALSAHTFERAKRRYDIEDDVRLNAYVRCVVDALIASDQQNWEVLIFKSEEPNAFALAGRKIGINTGLFRAALNADQLANVLGHEIAHVIANHGQERMSQQFSLDSVKLASSILTRGSGSARTTASGLTALAQLGILYPFSQIQENEADLIGLELASNAGFDPQQAIYFWQNMEVLGVVNSDSALSSHPAVQQRIQNLKAHMKNAQAGKERPKCEQ